MVNCFHQVMFQSLVSRNSMVSAGTALGWTEISKRSFRLRVPLEDVSEARSSRTQTFFLHG
jgi:hypothetical protein